MPVIIDGTLGVNAAAVTTTNWNPTNLSIPGNATIGDASSDTLTINGASVTFAGTATRIKADFSNDTVANQAFFQTTIANTSTQLRAIPNGNGTQSGLFLYGSSDIDNNSWGAIRTVAGVDVRIQSHTTGTGTLLPITFMTGTTERMRIGTTGSVNISTGPLIIGAAGGEGGEIQLSGAAGGNSFMIDVGPADVARLIQNANQPMQFYTNGVEKARLDAAGNFIINATSSQRAAKLFVKGANVSQTSTLANFIISTSDTQAADIGGSIGLGGLVGGDDTPFGYISGRKENSTAGNYAGYLAFATQNSGAGVAERMRINSTGTVLIGTTSTTNTSNTPLIVRTSNAVGADIGGAGITGAIALRGTSTGAALVDFTDTSVDTTASPYFKGRIFYSFADNYMTFGTNSTQEWMRIKSDGKIGIGTNSPGSRLDVNGDINISNSYLHLSGDYTAIHFMSGTSGDLYMDAIPGSRSVRLRNWNGSSPNWSVTDMQAGTFTPYYGVRFQATQNKSGDANTLDDYEEGSFTPVITFGGASTGIGYNLQTGYYIKVGQLVYFVIRIWLNNKGTATGQFILGGLPFNNGAISSGYLNRSYFARGDACTYTAMQFLKTDGNASFSVVSYDGGTTITNAHFTNSTYFTVSGTYDTSD